VSRGARRPGAPRPAPPRREPRIAWNAAGPALARWASPAAYAVIAAFAAALAFMIAGPHPVGDVFTESDFYGAYGLGARALQHGHIDPSRYGVVGPVYEVLLAVLGLPARSPDALFLVAELIALASMSAALVLWFRIVRARLGALAGLVATLLLASNAQLFRYGYAATTDAPALALQAGCLALLLAGAPGRRGALHAGLVGGIAFLTRYTAAVLLPAGLVALLAGWTDLEAGERRAAAVRFASGFLAPVLPWIAFSLASGAHFRFVLHYNIAYEVFAHARGIPWDTYERTMEPQFPTPWSVLARDPVAVISRIGFNVADHVRLDVKLLTGRPLAIAAGAGLLLGARGGGLARLNAVWLAMALTFLALVPAFHSERYSLAVLPGWAALATIALTSPRLALVLRASERRVWLKPALTLLLLGFAIPVSIAYQRWVASQLPIEVREAARRARPLLEPGENVYARKPHFAWEAGLTAQSFPFVDSLEQLAAAARRDHVRWLYFSWPDAETRPQFMYLLDTTSAVPGLTPRVVTTMHPAVLYEIGPGFGAAPAWSGDAWQLAVHRARAMVLINARDWRSRMVVANEEQRHGRWPAAESMLELAERIHPNDPELVLMHADNLVHLGRYGEAGALYESAERLQPGNPRTRIGAGWAALLSGNAPQAAELWRPMVPYTDDPGTLERMQELFDVVHDAATAAQARDRMRALGLASGAGR
jgi:hypothetical protein